MSVDESPKIVIQEGTAWGLHFVLKDKDLVLETPTEITYKIHDESSASLIQNGSITPADTFELALNVEANTLIDRNKTSETRILTLVNTYGGVDDKQTIVYRWTLKRSKFLE